MMKGDFDAIMVVLIFTEKALMGIIIMLLLDSFLTT